MFFRTRHGGSGWLAYGVTSLHTGNGDRFDYDCDISGATADQKNYCRTIQTAGAFVLIFGLVAIISSFALLVLATMNLAGQFQLEKFNPHVPTLANIQWIALQGMVMIWVRAAAQRSGWHGRRELARCGRLLTASFSVAVYLLFLSTGRVWS